MIMDSTFEFSDDQAITATAVSTNVIDLGVARDIGAGQPVPIIIQVTEAFNNLTSLQVDVEEDDNSGFSSAKVLASATLNLADLVVGARFPIMYIPQNAERYLRLNYTVTGTAPTTGKVAAAAVAAHQTNG